MMNKIKQFFLPCPENNYRPKILTGNVLFYYLIIILVLRIFLFPIFVQFPKSIFFAEITKDSLVELVNRSRQSLGLPTLKENPKLDQAAYLKAKDMLEKGYFSHQSPDGKFVWDLIKNVGYTYQVAGENLAIGFLESEQVHSAWINSSLHKANILNPNYQEIGIAVVKGEFEGKETQVVVQLFGAPKPISKSEVLAQEMENIETPSQTFNEPSETPPTSLEETEILPPPSETSSLSESTQPSSLPELLPSAEFLQAPTEKSEKSFGFNFWQFLTLNYHNLIQKFIYFSLVLIVAFLIITVFYDIFIYNKFKIDYKDLVLKTIGFCLLLIALLYLDKSTIVDFITLHTFKIY